MKRLSRLLIVTVLLNVLAPLPAVTAQQQSASGPAEPLREQIARLESIERDPETSPEVRELNRNFLLARRAQLRAELKKRVGALEAYLSSGAGILSSAEANAVSASIRSLRAELQSLGGEAPTNNSPKDSNTPRFTPASYTPAEPVAHPMPAADTTGAAQPPPAGGAPAVALTPVADCDATLSDGDDVTYTVAKDFDSALATSIKAANDRIPPSLVATVLQRTLYTAGGGPVDGDYAITHVIEWGEVQNKAEAIRERWTLFQLIGSEWKTVQTQKGTRIYGHRRVHVLAIHLNTNNKWDIDYTVSVKKKTPTNIANVLDLLSVITSGTVAKKAAGQDLWGGGLMCINSIPSDIEVQAEVVVRNSDSVAIQQPKTYNKTYDNEGKYWWDVSIGVPFKEVKSVQFNSSNGVVTAKEVTRQSAYGFLNIFLFGKQDLTGDSFLKSPHLVLGVPIASKPLDRPVVGLGYGIRKFSLKFDFFAGLVFNRVREPRTLAVGEAATENQLESDLQSKRVRKFIFGVNLPLRQVKEALTGDN
jgi:hypothetical protein